MLHLIPEFLDKQVLPMVSIGSYTAGKILGFVSVSSAIKDTWHFQFLQELAFVAAILSFVLAVANFHLNKKEKKKNVRVHKVSRKPKAKN